MSHDFLRSAMYQMKREDEVGDARDAKWRKEQDEARAKKEAALDSARITMEDPVFLTERLGLIDKNSVYRLVHLLAYVEGICPLMSHINTMDEVSIFREAALKFRLNDCLARLMKMERRFYEFERLSKFHGKTPQTVEDERGEKTLVVSDFIDWAIDMGWVPADGPIGDAQQVDRPKHQSQARNGDDWKHVARKYAVEFIQKWSGEDKPSMDKVVAQAVAKRLEQEKIVGRGGKARVAGTVYRHALKGHVNFETETEK